MSKNNMRQRRVMLGAMSVLLLLWTTIHFGVAPVEAARMANIRATKHNLSANGNYTVKANSTQTDPKADSSQICVFCHTPHGATEQDAGDSNGANNVAVQGPLWNKKVPWGSTYTPYTSSTLDAQSISDGFNNQPGGSSKLCLSCHDATLAVGNVGVIGGKQNVAFSMAGTGTGGVMPNGGYGANTGYTRNLSNDLTNDHPISVTYNHNLAAADGEMRDMDTTNQRSTDTSTNLPSGVNYAVGIKNSPKGTIPLLPLEKTSSGGAGQVQCASCHDPHITDPQVTDASIKFLRANRFQVGTPGGGSYDAKNDIICLACHNKGGTTWSGSVHATATLAYKNTGTPNPIAVREFPNRSNFQVWEAACLNCHDTHTVQGARRLLREGTNDTNNPKKGGTSAIEETCFQCHRLYTDANNILNLSSQLVPDIMSDFASGNYHMPIRSTEQCAGTEVHNIGDTSVTTRALKGKDFYEDPALLGGLGAGSCDSGSNRHAECTDCHNPHRALKNSLADGTGVSTQATHPHVGITGAHSNALSGALKGTYGVEPTYGTASFGSLPSSYTALCGVSGSTNACTSQVTKEYQICLKCHSDYAYTDSATAPYNYTGRPPLAASTDTARTTTKTPYNQWANGAKYTNQAMEFQAPSGDTSEYGGGGSQNSCWDTGPDTTCNHRSWHPVIAATGRTGKIRGNGTDISTNWRAPFSNAVGNQTIYCTDCHGSDNGTNTNVVPTTGKPWGPHGSTNPFILKGTWNTTTGAGHTNDLCFKCHDPAVYVNSNNNYRTGFYISGRSQNGSNNDGHYVHNHNGNLSGKIRCNWCHIAVPHGWKNKALLVNLNDVGPEVGQTAGTQVNGPYTQGPYYRNAMLKVYKFSTSGNWGDQDCGSKTGPSVGKDGWMKTSSNGGCVSPP